MIVEKLSRQRRSVLLLALLFTVAGHLAAQDPSGEIGAPQREKLRVLLDSLQRHRDGDRVDTDRVHIGDFTVRTDERIDGDVVVFGGRLDVRGAILGDAVALGGDVVLHDGSRVQGDAIALGGEVQNLGGSIDGELHTISRLSREIQPRDPPRSPVQATWRAVSFACAWFGILAAIGVVVLWFARHNLETVASTIRNRFSQAFAMGLVGQVALLPVLIVSVIVLAVTLIGLVLIPFAVVGYVLAAAGALALGFLAMAYVSGQSLLRGRAAPMSAYMPGAVRYLLAGLSLFLAFWLLAAILTWTGSLGGVLRLTAGVITWAAATVGFGATLISRGGTRVPGEPALADISAEDTWETPTPVSGVAAARRPTPAPRR